MPCDICIFKQSAVVMLFELKVQIDSWSNASHLKLSHHLHNLKHPAPTMNTRAHMSDFEATLSMNSHCDRTNTMTIIYAWVTIKVQKKF